MGDQQGCSIFVKLDQFAEQDNKQLRIDTGSAAWSPGFGGLEVMPLDEFEHEHVALLKWPAGERFQPPFEMNMDAILPVAGYEARI